MAYSIQTAVSDGTLEVLDLSIKYMDKSHIFVYVDDVLVDGSAYSYVWLTDTRIQIVPAVASGSTLKVIRKTLTDEMWHEFSKGARFSTTSMDENFEQLLFLAQEYSEGIYISDFYSDVDLHLKRILNLGNPINDGDAVNLRTLKEYLPNADLIPPLSTRLDALDVRVQAEELVSTQLTTQGIRDNQVITGFNATNLPNGALIYFAGRDTVGDGGGGPLRFLQGSTATADGGTVYETIGGRLVREGWSVFGVDASWFGVKAGSLASQSTAFQNAINKSYGNTLKLPAGSIVVDDPLVIAGKVEIQAHKRGTILKKTTTTASTGLTRTYVDSAGVTQTLTWADPVVFNVVCPVNSYITDVQFDGIEFDLPSDGSVGAINAQRAFMCSFKNMFSNYSKYFFKGYDIFMTNWENIRSRFSKDHFNITKGTSNTFITVYADTKHSSGGNGFTFKDVNYSVMNGCGADSVDRSYYFDNSNFTLDGCGTESFSRLLHAVNGSNVVVNGGSLQAVKTSSAMGTYYPYQASGAGTKVTFNGTWLGVPNPGATGGTYANLTMDTGAQVVATNIRYPVELLGGSKWWYVTGSNSALTLVDHSGTRYINEKGTSRLNATSNIKAFEMSKTVTAGSAQSVFRIDNSSYGSSCFGSIKVRIFNPYSVGSGFVLSQSYEFACVRETNVQQNLTKLGDALAQFNGTAVGTITGTLVRNGDNTVDFQLNIPVAAGDSTVMVSVEYMNYVGTAVGNEVITAV